MKDTADFPNSAHWTPTHIPALRSGIRETAEQPFSDHMIVHFLGLNYAPDEIGTAVYSTGLVEELARRGHEVTAICGHPYYPQWRRRAGWPAFSYQSETSRNGARVIRCPIYVPRVLRFLSRMAHYLSFAATAFPRLLAEGLRKRPDVVLVVAPSLVSAIGGVIAGRLRGAKLWLHIQDFEVEAAFATGALDPNSLLGRMALRFENAMLRRFDMISSISPQMLDKLREKGVDEAKILEVRNWADLSRINVVDNPAPMKAELGITTRHVAYYSGNVAAKQGLEIIPDAARILAHRDDLTFVICGEGPYLDTLKRKAAGLHNVTFLPLQPVERLNEALGMADLHLLPQIAGVASAVLPSKLTNMLASGRPVIATAEPDTALAREIEGAGIATPPQDAKAFAEATAALLDDPARRRALGVRARELALENWSMHRSINRLEHHMRRMVETARPRALRASDQQAIDSPVHRI
ncbi:WcaI family glycosyltransferase [Celeribacter sp.]|uniref:WcaI family glycosyltransferase n=1 Tax=Celeribacter sp. TaxID=1890673 RepID=UPI003A952339